MNQHRPFRFGILSSGATSRKTWLYKAQQAEALGYSTLLIDDHLHNPLAPLTPLISAAEATTTLRLGSFVFGNDFRHPAMLAKEAATLDLLTDGRFELGVGTGYLQSDYTQSGMALESPGIRVSRFEEAIQVIKGLFADEPFSYQGKYYAISNLNGLPKPVQKPHPPLLIGGGSKRILSIAAREANIVSINIRTTPDGGNDASSVSAEATDQKIAWVRQAAGERFRELELNIMVPFLAVTDNQRQVAAQILQQFGLPTDEAMIDFLLTSPAVLIGTVDQIMEALQARRQRYGLSYIVVAEFVMADAMTQFAPIVAKLTGT